MKRPLRVVVLGLLVAVLTVAVRKLRGGPVPAFEQANDASPWPPLPDLDGAEPETPRAVTAVERLWVDPADDGTCPPDHPVKAKTASGIYHLPGGVSYARTRPDRCYRSAADAHADGLRPAKR